MSRQRKQSEGGFSLLELLMAVAVLGVGLPAVAYMFSVSLSIDSDGTAGAQAFFLANSLMNEISQRRFKESVASPGNGPEAGEVSGYDRRGFNDIDDYNYFKTNWANLSPPRNESGTELTDYAPFRQYVEVNNIAAPPAGPGTRSMTTVAAGSTDYKLVTVRVSWQGGKRNVTIHKVFAAP